MQLRLLPLVPKNPSRILRACPCLVASVSPWLRLSLRVLLLGWFVSFFAGVFVCLFVCLCVCSSVGWFVRDVPRSFVLQSPGKKKRNQKKNKSRGQILHRSFFFCDTASISKDFLATVSLGLPSGVSALTVSLSHWLLSRSAGWLQGWLSVLPGPGQNAEKATKTNLKHDSPQTESDRGRFLLKN